MKYEITLEPDGFSWIATLKNSDSDLTAESPTAHGALFILAKKVEAEAKGVSYEDLVGSQRS